MRRGLQNVSRVLTLGRVQRRCGWRALADGRWGVSRRSQRCECQRAPMVASAATSLATSSATRSKATAANVWSSPRFGPGVRRRSCSSCVDVDGEQLADVPLWSCGGVCLVDRASYTKAKEKTEFFVGLVHTHHLDGDVRATLAAEYIRSLLSRPRVLIEHSQI